MAIIKCNSQDGYKHEEYKNEGAIPFKPDGNDAVIMSKDDITVERVKKASSLIKKLSYRRSGGYVRKSVTFRSTEEAEVDDAKKKFQNEAKILHHARHTHVVELIMTYFYESQNGPRFAIIMDGAEGNLEPYLDGRKQRVHLKHLIPWATCLINSLVYIHGLGIRHRDIKPANILVKEKKILLADFGISQMGLGKTLPTTVPNLARARTREYCAPEVEEGRTRGRSADIFAFGAVLLEIFIARYCPEKRQDFSPILTGSYARSIDHVHTWIDDMEQRIIDEKEEETDDAKKKDLSLRSQILSLCRGLLDKDRDLRPTAKTLLDLSSLSLGSCTCRADVRKSNEDNLIDAIKEGSLENAKKLLDEGANGKTKGALHHASALGYAKIVEMLLNEKGADINIQNFSGETALHCAAGYGHQKIVNMLLANNADVTIRDDEGRSVLHCAASNGNKSTVRKLLEMDKRVDIEDGDGRTPLHLASARGNDEVVLLLLENEASADITDNKGRTALHCAAASGSNIVIHYLLRYTANIDAQDQNDQTPLHFAVFRIQEEVVKLLLEKKADPDIQDSQGRTALQVATELTDANRIGSDTIKQLLESVSSSSAITAQED